MASNRKETAMKTVRVKTAELKITLAKNLAVHRREYAEAHEGYTRERKELMAKLAAATATCASDDTEENRKEVNDTFGTWRSLDVPQDHSSSYEQAIALMEWETRDEIDLSVNDFECYVRDRWGWQQSFKSSHRNYSGA